MAGTPVQTEDGVKKIEEIKKGDRVLSWNADTGQTEYKAVTATFTREAEIILDVRIANAGDGETLGVTPEHPFYVKVHKSRDSLSSGDDEDEGEWRNADQLQAGDLVLRPSGEWVAVLEITERAGGARVYNFEVEGNHNYYVGDVGVLVHNCGHKNANNAISNYGIYKIEIGGKLNKFGKADLDRITQSSGLPTRLHQQIRILEKTYSKVRGKVIEKCGKITTKEAKDIEDSYIQKFYDDFGFVPKGNEKSFIPK